MKQKTVKAIQFEEAVGSAQLVNVIFTDSTNAYMFTDNVDKLEVFIGKDVIVETRSEVFRGKLEDVINTWTALNVVSTLDRGSSVKLYSNDDFEIGASTHFDDILEGVVYNNVILFCDSAQKGSSPKANWISFRVMDKQRHISEMKVFNTATDIECALFNRKYILVNGLVRNKYGLNADDVEVMEHLTVHANPDVVIAKQAIIESVKSDVALVHVLEASKLLDRLAEYTPIDFIEETGSSLMRLAVELVLADQMDNVSKRVDTTFLKRLIVASNMYVLTHKKEHPMSTELQSIINVTKYKEIVSPRLMGALEENPRIEFLEANIMKQLKSMSKMLIQSKYITGVLEKNDRVTF